MTEIRVPQLSVNDPKAVIVDWVVKEGAFVEAGQEICVIETSKVTQAILAERAGYIRLKAQVGDEVEVNAVIAWLGDRVEEPWAESAETRPSVAAVEVTQKARELARAMGVRLEDLPWKGRIIREKDVREFAALRGLDIPRTALGSTDLPAGVSPVLVEGATPLSRAQRLVKENVLRSLGANAHSYVALEVCFDHVTAVVAELTERLGQAVRPTDAVIFALGRTLPEFPSFNGFYWNDHLIAYKTVNVGLAVDLDGVLIVPVIRDAHTKPLEAIARESSLLQLRVFRRTISPAECVDGTFTLTSLAGQGIQTFVPVINGYQAAILAVGAPTRRAVLREGAWAEAQYVTLGLSYDHRLNNGAGAARFLNGVKGRLERLAA